MPRIAKHHVASTLEKIGRNIIAAAGRDGVASRRDIKGKGKALHREGKHIEAALTRKFVRLIDHLDHKS